MGKPTKKRGKFDYDKNRRNERRKSKKRTTIECKQLKEAWNHRKGVCNNLKDMGLSDDPNRTIGKHLSAKVLCIIAMKNPVQCTCIPYNVQVLTDTSSGQQPTGSQPSKVHVALELEKEANAPQPRRVRLSDPDVKYCIYMMEKYGEDYKKMARDHKNYYQDTPKQIRRKIMNFKSIPEQYNEYLQSKQQADDTMDHT